MKICYFHDKVFSFTQSSLSSKTTHIPKWLSFIVIYQFKAFVVGSNDSNF